jgi:exopolysaccharide biosynthesis polyprenyl glycosylphosphotransferase
MRSRDRFDFFCSALAVAADACAVFAGFMTAVWIRFDTGWIAVTRGLPPRMMYVYAAGVMTLLMLFIFRSLELYKRPQYGHFTDKIPRIVRACSLGILLSTALAFAIQHDPPFSRLVTGIAFLTVTLLVIVERNILHQLERHWAKYQADKRNVVILGTNTVASRLRETFENEPRRRARVVAFLRTDDEPADPAVPADLIRGDLTGLAATLDATRADEVLLASPSRLNHQQLGDIVVECERRLADFHMVPDMFSLLTSRVDVQTLDGIPLLGMSRWPLDFFWNRAVKRLADLAGSLVGLLLFAPVMALAALAIRLTSPGPVFYMQERCGEKGQVFRIWKLRTMKVDAESESGPVWTVENDPRRTAVGGFLRRWNIDELPQFWNVLAGDMSLVGPRPERPHFVEQFKEDIQRYMQRHAHKPGMTGWAQVNGLRGNTSIHDRIKYDLFYLENWSLALDFKIILRTLVSTRNAY